MLPLLSLEDPTSQSSKTNSGLPLLPLDTPPPVSTEAIRQNLHFTKGVNPDQAAEDHRLGQVSGFAPDLVSRNRDEIRSRVETNNIVSQTTGAPGTQRYLSDQKNMAISKDDVGHLVSAESQFQQYVDSMPKQEWWKDVIQPTPARAWSQFVQGAGGVEQSIGELLGISALSDRGKFLQSEGKAVSEQIDSEHPLESFWPRNTASALSSMYMQAPFMALGALAKSAWGATATSLSLMGLTTAGQTYGERRDAGHGILASGLSALFDGTVEVGTELLPTKTLFEMMKPAAKMGFGKLMQKVVGLYGEEMVGESIATFLQDSNAKVMQSPDMTTQQRIDAFGEYLSSGEAKRNWLDTLGSTFVQTSLMSGAGAGMNRIANRKYQDVQHAEKDAALFASLEDLAAGSKTRQRLPAAYESFVNFAQEQAGGKVANVFVDAELLQSAMPAQQLTELLDKVDISKDTFAESVQTGSAVVIPISKYLAHVAGTEVSQAIRNDLRFREDGMSLNEATDARKNWAENMQGLIDEDRRITETSVQFDEEGQQVHDGIYAKLIEAGQNKDVAEANAVAWRAFAVTAPTRYDGYYGATPAEVYQKLVPEVQSQAFADHQAGKPEGWRTQTGETYLAKAKELFGITTDAKQAGFISPGGELINMAGDTPVFGSNHSAIAAAMGEGESSNAPFKFGVNTGSVRMRQQGEKILNLEFFGHPTQEQIRQLDKLIHDQMYVVADITAPDGRIAASTDGVGRDGVLKIKEALREQYGLPGSAGLFQDGTTGEVQQAGEEAQKFFDRRNLALRDKLLQDMTPEEKDQALLLNELTHIPNRRAYNEDVKRNGGPMKVQVSLDADSLKFVNDNLGHHSGDNMLMAIAEAMHQAAKELENMGFPVKVYHVSGDEFLAQSDNEEATAFLLKYVDNTISRIIIKSEEIDGYTVEVTPHLTHGVDTNGNLKEADRRLRQAKNLANARGVRSDRGQAPHSVKVMDKSRNGESLDPDAVKSLFERLDQQRKEFAQETGDLSDPDHPDNITKRFGDITSSFDPSQRKSQDPMFQSAWHGSPHTFDKFSSSNIGTGEGNHTFGHGLYFAGSKEVAEFYKKKLAKDNKLSSLSDRMDLLTVSGEKLLAKFDIETDAIFIDQVREGDFPLAAEHAKDRIARWAALAVDGSYPYQEYAKEKVAAWENLLPEIEAGRVSYSGAGRLYKVELAPAEDEYLLWDKPLSEQSEKVKAALQTVADQFSGDRKGRIEAYFRNKKNHPYQALVQELSGGKEPQKKSSETFLKAGIRGVKYLDGTSRDKGEGNFNYVLFSDADVSITERYQNPTAPRGAFTVQDGKPLIKLFETANPSTFLHETGHVFFTFMEQMAARSDAPQALKDDWQTLVDYTGSKDGKLANEHHETLARALETYFMEGTAPSPKLRSIFQQFAAWLKAIYRQVSALKAPVNDDIRQVFDRMFATDTEIEQAKAYYSAKEDFLSVAQVDDAAAAEKYRKLRAKADEDAGDTRLRKYAKAYMQALGGKKELEAEARAEINAQPAYATADSAVAAGGFSADMLDALLGKEKRTQLGKRRVGLITQKGEADIDAVMAAHGYENPTDMFDAILAAENKTAAVERLVKDRIAQMQETIRKDLADGPVAADSDYHSDSRMAVLIAEVELINKKRNLAAGRDKGAIRRLEIQAIRDAARQVLQSKTVTEATRYYQYSRAEAKAAKQAMDAFKTGDFDNAERFKRRELLNHALVLESIKAKEDVESIEGRFNRAVDRKNVDSSYHAQALRFLMVNGLTQRRIGLPDNTKSFEAFLEGLRHEDADSPMAGSVPVWSEWAMTGKETKGGWRKNFSLAELQEADSIVRWLVETGADLRNGRLAEYQQTIDEIVQTTLAPASSLKSKHIYGETHPMRRGSVWVQKYLADHTQLMFIFDSLDGFKAMVKKGAESFGPNRTLIGHKLADAQDARDRLQKEVHDKLLAPIRQLAKSAAKHGKSIPGISIPETMRKDGRVWTYERVVAAALNMGNPTNTMRVASGYGLVTDDEVSLAAGNLDGLTKKEMVERLQQVRSQLSLSKLTHLTSQVLTAEDWGAVQEIWNVVNSYWDQLDEVHHKVNHFHREKVQARPFQVMLADGTAVSMDGGYYPLKYDRILSDQVAEWSEQDDLFNESVFGHPGVESGMIKSRVAGPVRMPVDLSLSVLFTHMEDVIHYITHAAIIKDVDRITRDATYAEVVKDKLGREAYHAIRPILRNIAKPDRAVGLHLDTMFDRMRVLASAYVLGLNTGVAVKQLFSIPSMWHDIGFGNWLRGVKHVMTSPVAAYQAMQELSPYLATRATSFDREVRDSANAIMGKGFGMDKTRRDQLRDIAFIPIQVMDMLSVYPSWWAAFNAERARGGDEKAAVRYADEMIRASQPTSKAMEQAKVLYTRAGMTRFFSMFMTFVVNFGNRQRYFYRGWKEGKISNGEFAKWVALDAIAPILLQNMVLGALWGGAGGDDDHPWLDSALDVLLYQFSGLVFVRDAAGMAISGIKKHVMEEDAFVNNLGESAVLTGFKLTERAYTSLLKMVDDLGDDTKVEKAIWAFSEIASYWAGVPVAKMVRNIKEGMRQYEEEDGTLFNIAAPDPQKRRRNQ